MGRFRGAGICLLGVALATADAVAQQRAEAVTRPCVRVRVAADPGGSGPPALVWLRRDVLPVRPDWPALTAPMSRLGFEFDAGGMRVWSSYEPLPTDVYALGEFVLPGTGEILFACGTDGTEDWFVPGRARLPRRLQSLLASLHVDALGSAHAVDLGPLLGNLAAPHADGEPGAAVLRAAGDRCGEVTWTAWRSHDELRVRGRSGGGLLLPALLWSATVLGEGIAATDTWDTDGPLAVSGPTLRARVARDGDRSEAARQLGRGGRSTDVATLRTLLLTDGPSRLAAIDALVRLRATTELPQIVAAADPLLPFATPAVIEAVAELWPAADEATRQATETALARSHVGELRDLGARLHRTVSSAAESSTAGIGAWRWRLLLGLGVLGFGLFGLWWRERTLLALD